MEERKAALKRVDAELKTACEALTQSRRALADGLSRAVMEQLGDLGMAKTRFEIRIEPEPKPGATGADRVEFLISPNPGEPLKPMSAIASGGELSRIMLALKAISMDAGGVDSMVFDEIDTGVSGRMAQVVGEKMCRIARSHQVLCVTHLPQIAALGDVHFVVEKRTDGERTQTSVHRLNDEGRVRELSRLVGGAEDSESSLSHARHMLSDAAGVRQRLHAALDCHPSGSARKGVSSVFLALGQSPARLYPHVERITRNWRRCRGRRISGNWRRRSEPLPLAPGCALKIAALPAAIPTCQRRKDCGEDSASPCAAEGNSRRRLIQCPSIRPELM